MMFDIGWEKPFVLSSKIKPLNYTPVLFGPAVTCEGRSMLMQEDTIARMNDDVRIEMFKAFYPGCVQVLASNGVEEGPALYGDVTAAIAKKFGAVGAVIDAPTRDAYGISQLGFALFCRGVHPESALYQWVTTDFQTPIDMSGIAGDVHIDPGDYVFGDWDGVLIIPQQIVETVLDAAEKRMYKENIVRKEIENASIKDLLQMKKDVVIW